MSLPSAEKLRALFSYDAESGAVVRRVTTGNNSRAGRVVGACSSHGYRVVRVDGTLYPLHRVIWCLVHGEWPTLVIDHINGDRADNRLANLRDVVPQRNSENHRRARTNNKCGLLGASPADRRFVAVIHTGGKKHYLGRHDTPEQAHSAYVEAKRRLHPGCTL